MLILCVKTHDTLFLIRDKVIFLQLHRQVHNHHAQGQIYYVLRLLSPKKKRNKKMYIVRCIELSMRVHQVKRKAHDNKREKEKSQKLHKSREQEIDQRKGDIGIANREGRGVSMYPSFPCILVFLATLFSLLFSLFLFFFLIFYFFSFLWSASWFISSHRWASWLRTRPVQVNIIVFLVLFRFIV